MLLLIETGRKMFNPNQIDLIRGDRNDKLSFVGIRRNSTTKRLEFCMPVGLEDFPNDFEKTKELFKNTYRTLRKFLTNRKINIKNKKIDGFVKEDKKGVSLKSNYENEISLQYSKLVYFDNILDAYDDFLIQALQDKLVKTENIDYSKIHKYLHKAVYLGKHANHAVYIDEMELPKKVIQDASTELIEMFCFIYVEIQNFLGEPIINPRVEVLAQNFSENNLTHNNGLFEEETLEETIIILKDKLLDIEQYTSYKDQDFWHFFEAIEIFLYGELDDESEGNIIWGIDNFPAVWEELCYAYAETKFDNQILYADRSGGNENKENSGVFPNFRDFTPPGIYINPKFDSPFNFELNTLTKKRYLRPDLVVQGIDSIYKLQPTPYKDPAGVEYNNLTLLISSNPKHLEIHTNIVKKIKNQLSSEPILKKSFELSLKPYGFYFQQRYIDKFSLLIKEEEKEVSKIKIIDYKYVNFDFFESYAGKLKEDSRKQLIYELAIQLKFEKQATSEFWIPSFLENEVIKEVENASFCSEFKETQIKVYQLDFLTLQNIYLTL